MTWPDGITKIVEDRYLNRDLAKRGLAYIM